MTDRETNRRTVRQRRKIEWWTDEREEKQVERTGRWEKRGERTERGERER